MSVGALRVPRALLQGVEVPWVTLEGPWGFLGCPEWPVGPWRALGAPRGILGCPGMTLEVPWRGGGVFKEVTGGGGPLGC